MEKRGFYFNTTNNQYFYDDVTGNVSFENKSPENNILYGNSSYKHKIFDKEQVKNTLDNIGITQLTLIVTEECNLRCKYCVYSGEYDNNRTHANNYMDINIAKRAVEKYLSYTNYYRKSNLLRIPTIGFFGGEPLLNFSLIKTIVEYSKMIYKGKINYNITTNGTLLDENKIKFLVENNFSLFISLNGNKCENDRLRIYSNGSGTYDSIMKNIALIYSKYPKYFDSNLKIISVFDNGTDLFELKDFFEKNSLVKDKLSMLSKVIDFHTNWYERYSDKENKKYKSQLKKLKEDFYNNLLTNNELNIISKKLFSLPYFNVLNRSTNIELSKYKSSIQPFSGSCIPGTKIAVDYRGLLHMCEKVNSMTPIGNVEKWLDYDKISSIVNMYNKYLGTNCINCPVQRMCPVCYKDVIDNKGQCDFEQTNWCKLFIKDQIKVFSEIYSLMELGIDSKNIEKKIT